MSGLLALLDDVAAIAKIAAASVDDVASQAAKAGTKVAGGGYRRCCSHPEVPDRLFCQTRAAHHLEDYQGLALQQGCSTSAGAAITQQFCALGDHAIIDAGRLLPVF